MEEYQQRIVCAANRYPLLDGKGYLDIGGIRHFSTDMRLSITLALDAGLIKRATETQGFFTNTGEFVDRVEALAIAKAAGQLEGRVKHGREKELYSEDLY